MIRFIGWFAYGVYTAIALALFGAAVMVWSK